MKATQREEIFKQAILFYFEALELKQYPTTHLSWYLFLIRLFYSFPSRTFRMFQPFYLSLFYSK